MAINSLSPLSSFMATAWLYSSFQFFFFPAQEQNNLQEMLCFLISVTFYVPEWIIKACLLSLPSLAFLELTSEAIKFILLFQTPSLRS